MAGFLRVMLIVLSALFVGGNTPQAYGSFGCYGYVPSTASFYFYQPTYSYSYMIPYSYCRPTPMIVPLDGTRKKDANPVPAAPTPPRALANPDTAENHRPSVTAIRSRTGSNTPAASTPQQELCRVGFWNLSGRELTLTVAGKSLNLPKDESITLDLDRNFAWQIDQRPQIVEHVPEGQSTHELVIRD